MATSTIMNPNSTAVTQNVKSITRIATTVTTGVSGNIQLPYVNDGLTHIIAPCANGYNVFFRTWVSGSNGSWYLTAINPNTGATINDTPINIRYLVVKLYSAS